MPIVSSLFKTLKENILSLSSKIYYSFQRRDKNIWVFGEWFGKRCCDNCLYLANYLSQNHPELQLYWIALKDADLSALSKNVIRVEKDTLSAKSILKRAGVVLYIQGMSDITQKPVLYYSGAMVVNLWHGVPWKKIGIDALKSLNWKTMLKMRMQYGFYGSKFYLALSDEFARILHKAYFCSDKHIIKAGYPRNMLFYDKELVKQCRIKLNAYLKAHYHVTLTEPYFCIVYMPTFRDHVEDVFSFNNVDNQKLEELLDRYNAIILEKKHFVSSEKQERQSEIGNKRIFGIDNDFISQELLAASDMLITDYSSCFFDYLLLDKPIVHFLYDYHYYENDDRGLYYKKEDVACGDVAENLEQLVDTMGNNIENPQKDRLLREKRKNFYLSYESSQSCQHIYDFIQRHLYNQ